MRWRATCVRHGGPGAVHGSQPGAGAEAGGLNSTEVRERTNTRGIEMKDRGRVPAAVVVTFKTAAAK